MLELEIQIIPTSCLVVFLFFRSKEIDEIVKPENFILLFSETRTGNTLYQELSFQDSEAIGDVDEGADITGKTDKKNRFPNISECKFHFYRALKSVWH